MKPFNRFTTKGSYTRNITHNTGSTADWNLKPGRWDHFRFRRITREKSPVTIGKNNNNGSIFVSFNPLCYNILRTDRHVPSTKTNYISVVKTCYVFRQYRPSSGINSLTPNDL
jgi:hypothetical protein